MSFYDFLVSNDIDLATFGCLIFGIIFAFKVIEAIMFCLMDLITLPFVLLGKWNDIKRDKFLWHRDNYLFRKVEGLYDENGYCVKSIYYKYVHRKFGGR